MRIHMSTQESQSHRETNRLFTQVVQALDYIDYYQNLKFEEITYSDTVIYNSALRYLVEHNIDPFPGYLPLNKSINNIGS